MFFLTRVVGPLAERHRDDESIRRLDADITKRREEAFDRACTAIDSARFRKLLLDVAAWIEAGEWTRNEDEFLRALRKQRVHQTAFDQLERRWKKILKRGKRLESLDSSRLHRLRIAAKKLRYASDFFQGVFAGKKAARRRNRLSSGERLGERLGFLLWRQLRGKRSQQLRGERSHANQANGGKHLGGDLLCRQLRTIPALAREPTHLR
jgi:CHAD domain-containing protein